MQNMLRTVVGMLAGAALAILIMIAVGVRAQDGSVQTTAGESAPAQATIVDGLLQASMDMQYQGVLLDPVSGQPKADGTYAMTFRLYNQSNQVVWTESQSVPVATGLFSVLLGATVPLDQNQFNGQNLSLGVTVGSDPEMVPRQPLTRVPYAFQALSAQTANTATSASRTSSLCSSDGSVCKDYRNTAFSYGIVGSNGSMLNAFHLGSSSFDGTQYRFRLKADANTDVDYDPRRHVIVVTPYCDDASAAVPVVFAVSGQPYVYVRLFALNGAIRTCAFSAAAFYVQP